MSFFRNGTSLVSSAFNLYILCVDSPHRPRRFVKFHSQRSRCKGTQGFSYAALGHCGDFRNASSFRSSIWASAYPVLLQHSIMLTLQPLLDTCQDSPRTIVFRVPQD